MKQKKRIWWTFNLWEADAFQPAVENPYLPPIGNNNQKPMLVS